jgi:hypothetical protein
VAIRDEIAGIAVAALAVMRSMLLLAAATCGGGGGAHDAGVPADAIPDTAVDAAPARPQLATGGVQLVVSGPDLGLQITPADVATDSDVIAIHQEFYGVPWDAFVTDTAPPAAWVAKMDQLAGAARATGKPIFLSISMLNGGRDHLAARTVIDANGKVQSQDNWSARCYDFTTASDGPAYREGYLRYAAWMVREFSPRWLNLAVEVNLFFENCPAAAAGVIAVANAAYAQTKASDASILAFPSIQIDHLYGYAQDSCPGGDRAACFDQHYAQIAPLARDRFAMSSYPIPLDGLTAATLPTDWFTRGAARGGEIGLIAETGMDSTPLVVKPRDAPCFTVFTETEAEQGAYLARVLSDARAGHLELVTWWSNRDLVIAPLMTSCPCTFDALWCTVLDAFRGPPTTTGPDTQLLGELGLKVFGTMGLRSYAGAPKPFYPTWAAARAD